MAKLKAIYLLGINILFSNIRIVNICDFSLLAREFYDFYILFVLLKKNGKLKMLRTF